MKNQIKIFQFIKLLIKLRCNCFTYFALIFDKVDGYIRKYYSTKYLALFHSDE